MTAKPLGAFGKAAKAIESFEAPAETTKEKPVEAVTQEQKAPEAKKPAQKPSAKKTPPTKKNDVEDPADILSVSSINDMKAILEGTGKNLSEDSIRVLMPTQMKEMINAFVGNKNTEESDMSALTRNALLEYIEKRMPVVREMEKLKKQMMK